MTQKAPERLKQYLSSFPCVAILRGITPEEVLSIGETLLKEGIQIIEVPLNSPRPFESIERLQKHFGEDALIGAGTVLRLEELLRVHEIGGQLIVSPHCDTALIQQTLNLHMVSIPGVFTPTEAFEAIHKGAHALKWFPAQGVSPSYFRAMNAVLPPDIPALAVGGVGPETMQMYWDAGLRGFGVGGALYKPGDTAEDVQKKASSLRQAWEQMDKES